MKCIYKYTLDYTAGPLISVAMPEGARILGAGWQGRELVVWALVDPGAPSVDRGFTAHMTGARCGALIDAMAYVTTVTREDGLVAHVFVVPA